MVSYTLRTEGPRALDVLAAEGWDDLQAQRDVGDPLRSIAWLRLWSERVGAVDPHAVLVRRGHQTVAAAPLETERRGGIRVVRHLGAGDAWFHIAPPAVDNEALVSLLSAVAAEPGDVLMLDGLPDDDDTRRAVAAAIPGARLTPGVTWRLTTASPPRSLRKRRKEARRAIRRAAEHGVDMDVTWMSSWADIAPKLEEYLEFQHRHFSGPGVNQLAEPGQRRSYVTDALTLMGQQGRIRAVEVRLSDGALAAWDVAVVGDGGLAVAYAGAFDRSRTDLMMLGWISMLEMVERLSEEGVTTVDFGSWPAAYKDLIAEPVPIVRITAPLSQRGRTVLAARRALSAARDTRARRQRG